ncbi:MAG: hypothetical protein R6X20_16525 [Phycisphaerae bacterium]
MNARGLGRWAIALMGTILVSGCTETGSRNGPVVGRVVSQTGGPQSDSPFPDITFMDSEGKPHRLSSLYADATIIALVEEACASADANLVVRTSEFGGRVTVVEITSPPGGCKSHEHCVMTRGQRGSHLVSLCDGSNLVRRALGPDTSDTVFVLDRYGRVAASGRVADFPWLRRRAIDLALEAHPATGERWDEWLGFTDY